MPEAHTIIGNTKKYFLERKKIISRYEPLTMNRKIEILKFSNEPNNWILNFCSYIGSLKESSLFKNRPP